MRHPPQFRVSDARFHSEDHTGFQKDGLPELEHFRIGGFARQPGRIVHFQADAVPSP